MPEITCYLLPKPAPIYRNAIRKLYKLLDAIPGYPKLPVLCRHDFHWLKRWVKPEYHKARLILNFLAP